MNESPFLCGDQMYTILFPSSRKFVQEHEMQILYNEF